MQLVEEPHDARLRGHGQRDIDDVDVVALHVVGELVDAAEHLARLDVLEAIGRAVVEEAGDVHAEIWRAADALGEPAAEPSGARDDGVAAHALDVREPAQ